ncbi:hypothetical protein ACFSTC_58705 [Nonomuraea ferruginea]
MPRHDGIWTLNALRERAGDAPPVLVLTTFDSDTLVLDAMRAGGGRLPAEGRDAGAADPGDPRPGSAGGR